MEKTIEIDGKAVRFKATASTARHYRQRFHQDMLREMARLSKMAEKPDAVMTTADLEIFENIAYTMAKQADPEIPDDPDEWLDQFNVFSIYQVLPEIMQVWGENQITTSVPKKKVIQ